MAFAPLGRHCCPRCLHRQPLCTAQITCRRFHSSPQLPARDDDGHPDAEPDRGAMSQRLTDLSEANIEEDSSAAKANIKHSGFDEKLKQRLLKRLEDAEFRNRNASAIAHANMPKSAGEGSRHHASARAWDGNESIEDAALRMLTDARKPLRKPFKIPNPARPPKKVDTGRSREPPNTGMRLANARDRSSIYSYLKDGSMKEEERQEHRELLKERFQPAARALPVTLQGLSALANERIEDAIARGQFKNLPRGKASVRDKTADSPFLDTTEYFMNKIIKKQEIVPPWIEKQQELISAASRFRNRLRADWKRHAARLIASEGGSLEDQTRRADAYAAAEARLNPVTQVEKLGAVNERGHLSQITLTGQLKPASNEDMDDRPVQQLVIREDEISGTMAESREMGDIAGDASAEIPQSTGHSQGIAPHDAPKAEQSTTGSPPMARGVFRDSQWEATERSYWAVAIEDLNSKARSYNLIAPQMAKKPYYSLKRELASCFADCAPQLANEIRERATAPKVQLEVLGGQEHGVLGNFGLSRARVYDERRPRYGFREFFRDLLAPRS